MPIGRFTFPLSIVTCLAMLAMGCGEGPEPSHIPAGTPVVRVLIVENRPQITLGATEPPIVHVGTGPAQQMNFPAGSSVPVTLAGSGWTIGTLTIPRAALTIEPSADGSVRVNEQPYHGKYRLVPLSNDHFEVINEVNLEDYLKGVLARELFSGWNEEAYKAQAIVARTYALYEARTSGLTREFDLYADQRSQVYGGISAETAKSRAAVDATMGICLGYGPAGHERIFKAYFSSCCGGITQSASDAFGDPATPPLSDQLIGPRCADSPHFNWGPVVIAKNELGRRMRAWGALHNQPERGIGDVARVDIQFENRFGRPVRFVVTDSHGTRYSIAGEDFRQAFNTESGSGPTIYSSFFKPVNEMSTIRLIDGHGFGHGVGLCQWCAEREATDGVRHEVIATTAYPGSRLVRAY
jgi:stage II sporulation protein D